MILFDLMNQILLEDNKMNIINFLCCPIISINENPINKFEEIYKHYDDNNFEQLLDNIQDLAKKPNKDNKERKLLSFSKEHHKKYL